MFSAPSRFAFRPEESVGHGFVRVLGQIEIQACRLRQHTTHGPALSKLVHDTRVLIKYLRALLWFAKPSFSSSEMHRAKSHLRKASHLLAEQRELVVIRSVLKCLSRKTPDLSYRKALNRIANAQCCDQITNEKSYESLKQAAAILVTTAKELERRAKFKFRWPSCSERLEQAFFATQRSGRRALKREDSKRFHDWRKKAKRLLYQLQLTQGVPRKRMIRCIKRVDTLQEKLGDYHDCVIAQERLHKNLPDDVPSPVVSRTINLLETRKTRLRKRAWRIAMDFRSRRVADPRGPLGTRKG